MINSSFVRALTRSCQSKMAKLFTPGPLNTSDSVKQAMLRDLGSRDSEFIETIKFIGEKLLGVAQVRADKYCVVPLQGSGSYSVEAIFANVIGNTEQKALILNNGAYAERMSIMCAQARYKHDVMRFDETETLDLDKIKEKLKRNGNEYGLVTAVHCETSTGNFNPVAELGKIVKEHSKAFFFVDAMSSFGAVPLDMEKSKIDFLVSSANKCIQGVPGFGYVIARTEALRQCKGRCLSWSFDLVAQLNALSSNGQFRCTPPTHALLAFKQALIEFEEEGGVAGRKQRYEQNNQTIRRGMKELGFKTLLSQEHTYIITSFLYPNDANFDFQLFYRKLSQRSQVIYPGKVSKTDCFRLGNIGDLHEEDCQLLIDQIESVLKEMGVATPVIY